MKSTGVSKLYYNVPDGDTHHEHDWETHKILASIDPKRQYFLWGRQICDVSEVERERAALECNEKKYGRKLSNTQMTMPRAAMSLESWLHKRKAKNNPPTMQDILKMLQRVLIGLSKLEGTNGPAVMHGDIKAENVVVMKDNTTRLIDFFPVYAFRQAGDRRPSDKYRDTKEVGEMLSNLLSKGLIYCSDPNNYEEFIETNFNAKLPSDVIKNIYQHTSIPKSEPSRPFSALSSSGTSPSSSRTSTSSRTSSTSSRSQSSRSQSSRSPSSRSPSSRTP